MSDPMKVFAFDYNGPAHLSSGMWRHPLDRGAEYKSIDYWTEFAQLLESACFDGVFFADNVGYHDKYKGSVDEALRDAAQIPTNDPAYLIPAMAAVTTNLGFGVTSTTTYDQPYATARKFATLDHLTKGRVGWNVVTSYADSAASNYGMKEQLAHDDRYARAEEFIEVATDLWENSWEEDAVVRDKDACTYVDPSKVHEIGHSGDHFSVPGIFLCEPSPQRTPVIFQAGGSSKGVALAAKTAEAVFMNATSKFGLKKQVDNLRTKVAEVGRDPHHVAVLQMVVVISAATDEEAQAKYREYMDLFSYDGAMARYSGWAGIDMAELDPDVPLRHVKTNAGQTMIDIYSKLDPSKEWTPRDIAEFNAIGGAAPVIVGGPETVADELAAWKNETGIDGFNIGYAVKFRDIADFAEFVVPELQRRGLMRTDYDGSTLRENVFGEGQVRLASDHPASPDHRSTAVPVA